MRCILSTSYVQIQIISQASGATVAGDKSIAVTTRVTPKTGYTAGCLIVKGFSP